MVDELELLKKDWQQQEETLPHYTKQELYPMLLKKSSSIVKWILIISVIEFLFWIVLNVAFDQSEVNEPFMKEAGIVTVNNILLIINYLALAYFVVRFYLNYKAIQTTDSAKVLMKNILKARGTVKLYIWFNVAFVFIGSIVVVGIGYHYNPNAFQGASNPLLLVGTFIIILAIVIGALLLIYRVIYGRLTRRLKSNYEQLKKLEI